MAVDPARTSSTLAEGETLVGHINTDGSITLPTVYERKLLKVVRTDKPTGKVPNGYIDSSDSTLYLYGVDTPTPWTIAYDGCDITKVKLQHMDGKSVKRQEYDKMHRFLRLWRKLSGRIAEVDAVISAFGAGPQLTHIPGTSTPTVPPKDDDVNYDDFQQPCSCGLSTCSKCNVAETTPTKNSNKSKGKVFVPDADGNCLVQPPPARVSEHRPILLAAFNLKYEDLDNIIRIAIITNDQLTLKNVSAIYRHSILAKMLGLKPKDLGLVFKISSTPWESAEKALDLLKL
ncbi:hypothetical protein K469DRAFT_683882 [Zopfia rhizophila CBS 207.26]|uniref:Uncharacterized protein n=1 Tax=Zopfia rhizophila CBS 207.26 TaxID=1314779 RepID=A0A6A6D7K5_9PEZI|nr:hypothetical protein K469DRAFT_683882 [Zopfia rhizophila CBS 207.26]